MKKYQKGFTVIELMVVLMIVFVFGLILFSSIANNRGWTEERAYSGANAFLAENNISKKRLTCAGDSDGDGYGTCNVVTEEGEKVILNCPTNWLDVNLWGASNCKEVFQNLNFTLGTNQPAQDYKGQ